MKRGNFRFYVLFTIGLGLLLVCLKSFGGEQLTGFELIGGEEQAANFWRMVMPWLAYVGAARLILKPIFTWIAGGLEKVVTKADQTEDARDDAALDSLLSSKVYFWVAWLADLLLSVKLPVKRKAISPPSS